MSEKCEHFTGVTNIGGGFRMCQNGITPDTVQFEFCPKCGTRLVEPVDEDARWLRRRAASGSWSDTTTKYYHRIADRLEAGMSSSTAAPERVEGDTEHDPKWLRWFAYEMVTHTEQRRHLLKIAGRLERQ